jgi:archaellum biogenesis protein FlaJ (TadC family)
MKQNNYGKFANLLFEPLTELYIKLFPWLFKYLQKNITYAGLPILTKTYMSSLILTNFIILALGATISVILLYQFSLWYPLIITVILIGISKSIFFLYPKIKANQRKRTLNHELPFTISLLATLSSLGLKEDQLFKPLLKLKQTRIEALRIINLIHFKKIPIENTLIEVAELSPSTKLKEFLKQLALNIKNPTDFLTRLAREQTQNYEKTRKLRKNLFKETGNIFHNQHLKIKHILYILLAIILAVVNFYFLFDFATYTAPFYFYILLIIIIIIAWIPIFLDINKKFKQDRQKENDFYKFALDLKTTKLQSLNKNYNLIDLNVKKLINQYKMGIPLNTAFNTFAKEVKNTTIKQIIEITLETNKPIETTLPEITKALILKNKLIFSSSKKQLKKE